MVQATCTICGRVLEENHVFEGRHYCETHIRRFSESAPWLWRISASVLLILIAEVAFLGVAALILPDSIPTGVEIALGIIIAAVPAIVWLTLLYVTAQATQQQISNLLPTVFVLGALMAAAITRPFLQDFIQFNAWLTTTSATNRFIGNILIGGFTHAFLIFAAVRFTVWRTAAFERRLDGVMFGLAAGWGYITTLNILYVIEQQGLTILNGNLRLVTLTCAFISMSLIIGYFLGRTRFEEMPFYYMGIGMGTAAFVNGLLVYTGTEFNNIRLNLTTDGFSPWPGLVINLIAITVIMATFYGLTQRHNNLTRARLHLED